MAHKPTMRISKTCAAPPGVVYDVLADLGSHVRWAGSEQRRDFRLLSLDAPGAPAIAGATFTTTGAMPMSRRHWEDRSTVTTAARPSLFEFTTDARAGTGAKQMVAGYTHRYEIAATGDGSTVTYTMTQERIAHPILRLGVPGMRTMMWRMGIPMFAGRGFRNLLREAEAAATRAQEPARANLSEVV